ncbi:MAG: hypothetical protein COT00_05260 [Candidatus Omnitrophica bacterium CG07_land_8_20_14_0_80_50_8]|nr:MAG: hypothetical protein COT00_05260 [Candidatus Omnitrophica bacterium CG07_land_8_20_14_0_80_50_8]
MHFKNIMKLSHHYQRMIATVKPHINRLCLAFVSGSANSLLSNFSVVGLIILFTDTILIGKPVSIPHQEYVPPFLLDLIHRCNAFPRAELLNWLILWMVVISFLRLLTEYAQSYFMNDVSQHVVCDLRNSVYEKIVRLNLSFFGKTQAGTLVSRITYDTTVVRDAISEGLTDVLFQPVEIIVKFCVLFWLKYMYGISWHLILMIVVLLPLVVYPVMRVGRRLKKLSRSVQEQVARINTTLFESISGIRIVQGFGMEKYEIDRFNQQNRSLLKTMMLSISRMIVVSPLTEFIGFICIGVVLWSGGKLVITNQMSPGPFGAFIFTLVTLQKPFKRLSRVYAINQQAMAAAERIFAILDTPNEIADKKHAKTLEPFKKEICFEHLSFGYSAQPVLTGIDLNVKAGEIVALVGPSGAGKTSLMNLLPRFYDVTEGRILIDGVDLRDVTLKSLREQIGIVAQETILFNDTVAANIAYGRPRTPLADIENAARIANAHAFISKLPLKYQTVIGDRGTRVSGGERQRLSIARTVLKNPPLLILDEATSALDSESEILVQEALHNLMRGRTVLVIAHRLSTIKDAHRIVVINEGRLAEIGTHDQLMRHKGVYKRLYELQFRV